MKTRIDKDRYGRLLILCLVTYLVLAGPIMGFTMSLPCAEPTLPRFVRMMYQPLFFVVAFNSDFGTGMWQYGALWAPRMHQTWVTVMATVLDLLVLCIAWNLIWHRPIQRGKRDGTTTASSVPLTRGGSTSG